VQDDPGWHPKGWNHHYRVQSTGRAGKTRLDQPERDRVSDRDRTATGRPHALPEVNSRQLAAVLAIAEYRSFIAAAAHLGISQPALTVAIKRLEQTIGLPLFQRTTRRVTVTVPGREFVAMAERILNDLTLSMRSLRELTDRQRGQVIVSSLPQVPTSPLIVEYGRRFPGIEIQLREGLQDDVRDDIRSGLADFGICYVEGLPASHVAESLGIERLWVVLRKDHPLAGRGHIEFRALRDVSLVSLPAAGTIRRLVDGTATAAGFALRHAVTVSRPLTVLNLVAAGVGIAVLPARRWPRGLVPKLVSRPLVRPQLSCELGIVRLRERELSPAAAGLLALARERLDR
jgi:DNA-binding transcriptional LysR family regulator